jgi:hypothetical protein
MLPVTAGPSWKDRRGVGKAAILAAWKKPGFLLLLRMCIGSELLKLTHLPVFGDAFFLGTSQFNN